MAQADIHPILGVVFEKWTPEYAWLLLRFVFESQFGKKLLDVDAKWFERDSI